MLDNHRILRLRHSLSELRQTIDALRTHPEAEIARLEEQLADLERDECQETRTLVGKALFLLELVEQNPRLREKLKTIVLGD